MPDELPPELRPQTSPEPLLSPEDLAARLGVPVRTIYSWRHRGVGPRGYAIGRHIRFRAIEVEAWIDSRADAPAELTQAG